MLAAVGGQVGSMAFDLHFFHPIFVAESCTKLGGGWPRVDGVGGGC